MPPVQSTPPQPSRFRAAAGPRAVERLLLAEIDRLLPRAGLDPGLLALPVLVVVPSASLRLHLCARIVNHRGCALAGLAVRTHRTLAAQIVERSGEPVPAGELLFDVLVRRAAQREPALVQALDRFGDGYSAAALSVRDLLDAGLTSDHAEALLELLAQAGPEAQAGGGAFLAERERVRALVRVAARVHDEMERQGLGRVSTVLTRARELVLLDGGAVLPARAVLVHGFADAVGLAADFLQALLQRPGARLFVDTPPDPTDRTRPDDGAALSKRFLEHVTQGAPILAPAGEVPPAPTVSFCEAPGVHAEVREAARRIRALLHLGVPAESIGVAARTLDAYRLPARLHFGRLAVPFSGVGAAGPATALHRAVGALLALLRTKERTPADRWLDCLQLWDAPAPAQQRWSRGSLPRPLTPEFELRLALRTAGAARVSDVAALRPALLLNARDELPLAVRRGLEDDFDPDTRDADGLAGGPAAGPDAAPIGRTRAPRRAVAGTMLRATVAAAQRLCARLREWPRSAPCAQHLALLRTTLTDELCWGSPSPAADMWEQLVDGLAGALPPDFALSDEELVLILGRALADAGRGPVGGAGGGVRLLSVTESRGCTFTHLFVLGLNRDAFPGRIRRDPLLPDPLRAAMRALLPDLPLKESGFHEERYLFAQLLEAADHVTLSWLTGDDDGTPRTRSPLVQRLVRALPEAAVERAPALVTPQAQGPVTAFEGAVQAGLAGRAQREPQWQATLQAAIEEGWRELAGHAPGLDARVLARARIAIAREFDRSPWTSAAGQLDLGPYFGFLGAIRAAGDPRANDLYVSTLERMAECPWRAFLTRLLHLQPLQDPTAELPVPTPLVVGEAVHAVLQRVVRDALPDPQRALATIEAALAQGPVAVPWPDTATLERALHEECARVAREHGLNLPVVAAMLRERVRPHLEAARTADWSDEPPLVLGAELQGVAASGGADESGAPTRGAAAGATHASSAAGVRGPALRFRADRVDLVGQRLRLTDYKTGAPLSTDAKEDTRHRKLVAKIAAGTTLQAALYARATGPVGAAPTLGRYLYIKPDPPGGEFPERAFEVAADDAQARDALSAAVRALLAVWREGAFFPRLLDRDGTKEPELCERCEVKQACVRGDSGLRDRLQLWTRDALEAGARFTAAASRPERALMELWALGAPSVGERSDEPGTAAVPSEPSEPSDSGEPAAPDESPDMQNPPGPRS
jgi:RecB family exonuclease